ncbi:UTP4 small subunit processome component l(3)72Dn [Choristoneura fumiferana]|uniref:UTP4 small subunit processome component l(3)72Dn n=1 Tax=Choristoneura fumiferana TaxID=7141 RepID=UPI003D154CDC
MASRVHRVRYYNPKPEIINCVSFNKSSKLLALARVDASIELWDLSHAPYLVKFIPGIENGSIEALSWVNDRLLSTGLVGSLVEWDLERLTVKNTVLLTGYAAWCLDVSFDNTVAAVGTEQGYINLFNVEHNDIVYSKLFDKQEGRVMCCKFDKTGSILVTGSLNSIRVWNTKTGHAITRMSVTKRDQETIVWCLAVLSDNIIVSGDSHGRLSFWDGALGDQIESYTTHKADILAIAVSDDEQKIYCSGVDPVILSYRRVDKSSDSGSLQWVKHVQRHIHEHDVRGLIMHGDKLISVGNDGYLSLSSFPPKWVKRVPPMIPGPRSSVSVKKKLLLLRYSNHLQVWKLGSSAVNDKGQFIFSNINDNQISAPNGNSHLESDSEAIDNTLPVISTKENTSLKIANSPAKLVSIQTKKKKQMRCCEISPSGEFIVYATETDIRMLKLDVEDDDESSTSLSKMVVSGVSLPANRVAFTEDSRTMVVHSPGMLQVLQVDPDAGATVLQTIKTDKYLKSKAILHLLVSKKTPSSKTYLVAADTEGAIAVWTHSSTKFELHATLPKYQCVPSAVTVDSRRESLVIVYVDQKLMEYQLANKRFEEWPQTSLPVQWHRRQSAVLAASAHGARDALVFQDETSLWILERPSSNTEVADDEPHAKRRPKHGQRTARFKVIPMKYLGGFHWLDDSEAVSIEILPENIVAQLPAACTVSKNHTLG